MFVDRIKQRYALRGKIKQGVEADVEFYIAAGLRGAEDDSDALLDIGVKDMFIVCILKGAHVPLRSQCILFLLPFTKRMQWDAAFKLDGMDGIIQCLLCMVHH